MDRLSELLRDQDGVVTRRQVHDAGLEPHDLKRMLRRRELAVVHPGVYVDHTGPLTWLQRAWAAVLHAGPDAALTHGSAIRAAEGPGRRGVDEHEIEVAIGADRHLTAQPGVRVRRLRGLDARVQSNLGPPRVRYDDAVIDVAMDARTRHDAIATLADACGGRRTTAARLLRTARSRPRLADRAWLTSILDDVAEGTCSVLEHGYLDRVERPHGLPEGLRQECRRHAGATTYSDVFYGGLVVELDGRLFHDSVQARDLDLARDLDAAVDGVETLRIGYAQVFRDACATATKVGAVLQRRGWDGEPRRCPCCAR